jgi:AraC family transcriptional regulator
MGKYPLMQGPQQPRLSSDGIRKVSSAIEVLHGLKPLVSNAESKPNDLAVERYKIEGQVTTPRVGFENQHLVAITWTGEVHEIGGALRSISIANAISIFPVGLAVEEQLMSCVEFTNLLLKPGFLSRIACETDLPNRFELVPQWGIRDEQIEAISCAAEGAIRSDLGGGTLFMESLATALAACVLARYSSRKLPLRQYRGGMSSYQLRRSIEFIEANLGNDLGLAELAANVRMSPYYFCRLFKQSTSLSPHQFVLRERIERAQQLLREHRLPIATIARELGFSDQSHFARVFHGLVGTTPRQYARQH